MLGVKKMDRTLDAAMCARCEQCRAKRRARQLERYQNEPAFRSRMLKAVHQVYWKNPELGRAKAYLRLWRTGRIMNPNLALLERYTAVLAPVTQQADLPATEEPLEDVEPV